MNHLKVLFIALLFCLLSTLTAQEIYLSSLNGTLYVLDLPACTTTPLISMPISSTDISFHPNGGFYAITSAGSLNEIDIANGTSNLLHTFEASAGQLYTSLTISADGIFYACGLGGDLWSYSLDTDMGAYLGNVGHGAEGDLTFHDGNLYMAATGDNIVLVDIQNPANSSIFIDENVPGRIFGIVSYIENCGEIQTFALTDNASTIYLIDFENATLEEYCDIPHSISGGASQFEFYGSNPLIIEEIEIENFDCTQATGTIIISATGGIGDLLYSVNGEDFQTNPEFTNLPATVYAIFVQDGNGCTAVYDIDLGQDFPALSQMVITPTSCGENNGSVEFAVSGGISPYQMSVNQGAFTAIMPLQNLAAGDYEIIIQDGGGCFSAPAMITIEPSSLPQMTINSMATTCGQDNGSFQINATGDGPFSYFLNGSPANLDDFSNLAAADFLIGLSDVNGCLIDETATIPGEPALTIDSVNIVDSSCGLNNGGMTINTSGGTGDLSYQPSGFSASQSPVYNDIFAGIYDVLVTDQDGCEDQITIEINDTGSIELNAISTASALCNDNTGTFTFEPIAGDGLQYTLNGVAVAPTDSSTLNELSAGNYLLVVSSSLNCRDTLSFDIPRGICPIYLPNVFSPNFDGINDVFVPMSSAGLNAEVIQFRVFDRWGGIVFAKEKLLLNDPLLGWNGRKNQTILPQSVYAWVLEIRYDSGEEVLLSGDVLLLR